ncbi:MAG: hypothetical protein ACJ716_18690 [Marmoricola sp.]
MTDEEMKARLRSTGSHFRTADQDRRRALAELKEALAEADGSSSPEEAAELTGLPRSTAGYLLDPDVVDPGPAADPASER